MTDRDFCYWLRGFFELSETKTLSKKQIEMIQRHLELVFENKAQSPKEESPDVELGIGEGTIPPLSDPNLICSDSQDKDSLGRLIKKSISNKTIYCLSSGRSPRIC